MPVTRPALALIAGLALVGAARAAEPTSATAMPLATAFARALDTAPALRGGDAVIAGARAFADQAGRWPNPTIGFEVDEFAGNRALSGFDRAEVTGRLSQTFELGGKRAARRGAAAAEIAFTQAERDAARRNVLADTLEAYTAAAAARTRLTLADAQLTIIATIADQSARRLAAGDVAQVVADRAEVDRATALAARDRAQSDLGVAERSLGSLVGTPTAAAAPDWLTAAAAGPPLPAPDLDLLPDAARFAASRARAEAGLATQRAQRIPDPTAFLGVRQLRGSDTTALVAGVSLPLPLFNRNGGAIARAQGEAIRANTDIEGQQRALARAIDRAIADEAAARRTLAVLDTRTLPAAKRVLELTQRGFTAGALPYRDLADALRAANEARFARVETLQAIQVARAQLLRITGDISPTHLVR